MICMKSDHGCICLSLNAMVGLILACKQTLIFTSKFELMLGIDIFNILSLNRQTLPEWNKISPCPPVQLVNSSTLDEGLLGFGGYYRCIVGALYADKLCRTWTFKNN